MKYFTVGRKEKYEELGLPFDTVKRVIVYETSFGWDCIMRQRPQQTALSFPDDTLVIYHSSKDSYETSSCFFRVKDNLYVANLDIYRKILVSDVPGDIEKHVIFYSTDPTGAELISFYKKHGFGIVYEYVDEISRLLCTSERVYLKIRSKYEKIISAGCLAVCTAETLYNDIKDKVPAKLVTNACDFDHFDAERIGKTSPPEDMKLDGSKLTVGYFGALAKWMDFSLLAELADADRYNIVLIGVSYDGSFEESGLKDRKNVIYLGKKDYSVLPLYAIHFDLCVIPFVVNEITRSTSPVKLFEYMSLGKPIVTTYLDECRKYDCVFCAETHAEFLKMLEEAYEAGQSDKYRERLKKTALSNTWDKKCLEILGFISKENG